MDAGEWIALVAVSSTIIALLGRVVWLLATMKASVEILSSQMTEIHDIVTKHVEDCDQDRIKLNMVLNQHEDRILRLESEV